MFWRNWMWIQILGGEGSCWCVLCHTCDVNQTISPPIVGYVRRQNCVHWWISALPLIAILDQPNYTKLTPVQPDFRCERCTALPYTLNGKTIFEMTQRPTGGWIVLSCTLSFVSFVDGYFMPHFLQRPSCSLNRDSHPRFSRAFQALEDSTLKIQILPCCRQVFLYLATLTVLIVRSLQGGFLVKEGSPAVFQPSIHVPFSGPAKSDEQFKFGYVYSLRRTNWSMG